MKLSDHARRLACELATQVYSELRECGAAQIEYRMQSQDGTAMTMVISVGSGAKHLTQHCETLRELGITQPVHTTIEGRLL